MNILSIDTSTDWCGISLFKDSKCKNSIEKYIPKKHSEMLPIFFESIIKDSGFNKKNIDAIAISIGPGSFTGLRIGLGFSKGLAYALNKPIVPVPTLQAIGNDSVAEFNDFIVMLFSHRNIVYYQEFVNKKPEDSPKSTIFADSSYIERICPTAKLNATVNDAQIDKPINPINFIGIFIDHACLPQ